MGFNKDAVYVGTEKSVPRGGKKKQESEGLKCFELVRCALRSASDQHRGA